MHWTVTAVLLTAHLLLVNVAMVGPLVAVWCDWRARRESQPVIAELGRRLAWIAVSGLVLGGLLGGVLLAIRYAADERYFRALAVVPRDRLWSEQRPASTWRAFRLPASRRRVSLFWAWGSAPQFVE